VLVDLKLEGKTVIVVGGGNEGCRKIQSFVDSGATIWVISKEFSSGVQKLALEKKLSLLTTEVKDAKAFMESLNPKPDIFLAVTNDSDLNLRLVKTAKLFGCMVYSVDNPALSDFILPAVAHVGEVRIAVSTSGKSPAMAKLLRQRIEEMIKPEDLLEIELQAYVRAVLRAKVFDSKARSKLLYEILNNDKIKQALKQGKMSEARDIAKKLLHDEGRLAV